MYIKLIAIIDEIYEDAQVSNENIQKKFNFINCYIFAYNV